jgi:hypothetical protein
LRGSKGVAFCGIRREATGWIERLAAYFRNGEVAKAVEASRKAKTVATMMPKAFRDDEVEAHLRQYEAALPKQ